MQYHTENKFAEFWIDNGILFFVYKTGVEIDMEAAEEIVSARLKLQQEKAYPVFCDSRGIKDSSKAARDYLAKEGSVLVKAVSILVETPVTRMMSNFYLSINKPLVPTQIFTDRNAALKHLVPYLEKIT